jgi:hypothetical protein
METSVVGILPPLKLSADHFAPAAGDRLILHCLLELINQLHHAKYQAAHTFAGSGDISHVQL